ncbi:ABC transporter ATP-binding protein [Candidatus Bathyarchaeota archaeon]|nr:ABC transporter ATP-binding protein [Candidatus Bathyarchaeota archaeon]
MIIGGIDLVEVVLEHVTKNFGQVTAADDISLKINDGELFFLLGPSGCGKTTTLRLIAGFYKPDQGKIFINKKIVNDIPPYKRNIGMVFQNYALWPHMTVYDNIIYGLKIQNVNPDSRVKKAKEVLKIVQMEPYALRYPNQLSGGQQQRIALARALVIEPEVLLLDEPLSNLDAKLRYETREEIKKIQKALGITSIYVTHDQSEALSMADKIAVMNQGRIEQIGTPLEIYNKPINRFVAGFIGETNFIEGKIEKIDQQNNLLTVKTKSDDKIFANDIKKPFTIDQDVVCSIRPEHIKVTKFENHLNEYNRFKGIIKNLNYYGSMEHYILDNIGTVDVKATNFNPEDLSNKIGDQIYFYFKPDDVDVFDLK